MSTPLVATKLFVPRVRTRVVDRSRLSVRLTATAEAKLTLVSAPAGFGKTTAVTAWLARASTDRRAVAWVSLEEGDGQPATFWTYVVSALQSAAPTVGASVLPSLQSGQPPTRALLAAVLNDVGAQPVDVDLVLDDYHLADGPVVADGMAYLLEHLPPNLHVVISSRADPDLPLARLRARGELVELRARDLRFTQDEVSAYLDLVGGLTVRPEDVATLADRTEGWAAALQLAALSMQGRDDITAFVDGFAGDDRYVVDYLVDEVLSRQSDEVRGFLLRTSVLERLTGSLCDAVTGHHGGRAMLEALDRANLFVVPLDDRRQWFRYHHLFAAVLQAHLADEDPPALPTLHRRASDWYAAAGEPTAAVRHALAAGDGSRAADLAEAALPAMQRDRNEAAIRTWFDDLPADSARTRPVLAIGFVGGLMQCNEFARAEELLREAEHWLPAIHRRLGTLDTAEVDDAEAPEPSTMVVVDEGELARVPAAVQMYRAALALVHGDPAGTIRHAEQALAEAVDDDHLVRGAAAGLSGLACWAVGELDAAHRWYTRCVEELVQAGHLSDVLGCTITLADIRITQGRLTDALAAYDDGLRLAQSGAAPLRGIADMHVGIAEIAAERSEIGTAREHLDRSQELAEPLSLLQHPYRWRATTAVLAEAAGDLASASALLADAERVYVGDFSPDVRPLHARRARVDVARGDLEATARWVGEHDLSPAPELSYLREFEHVTLAEVLLARHRLAGDRVALHDARALLERLRSRVDEAGRTGTLIDVLVLAGLAADADGDRAAALAALRQATALGEPDRHVRVFARHGAALGVLLDALVGRDSTSPYLHALRTACGTVPAGSPAPARAHPTATGYVEPLSPRELEVLRLLASDLDGPEIARHLVVSLNTVRTHTKNIYAKLGVNSRRAAVRRAHDLGLLTGR